MTTRFERTMNRSSKRRAYALYHDVVCHPQWVQLSVYSKLIWIEIGLDYHPNKFGKGCGNNGWLTCVYNELIQKRGFKSRSTIKKSLVELEWFGFIEKTFPGQFPKEPARYALTHLDYDQHPDNKVMAKKAPHTYKEHTGEPYPKH